MEESFCQRPVLFADSGVDGAGPLDDFSSTGLMEAPLHRLADEGTSGQAGLLPQTIDVGEHGSQQTNHKPRHRFVHPFSITSEYGHLPSESQGVM